MNNEREDRLMADAAQLATEISPERDLWPEIEAAMTRPARRQWMPYLAQAAAVVLLVGGSSFITYELSKSDAPTSPVVTTSSFDAEFVSFGEELRLSPRYEEARNGLAAQLDIALDGLSPDTRTDVERNLAVIRGAVADIKLALAEEPDSTHLQELLVDAYGQELSLMRQVGALTQNVMSRNDF